MTILNSLNKIISDPTYLFQGISNYFSITNFLTSHFLRDLDLRTILDVGANDGQFSSEVRKIYPAAKIIAFEPLGECFGNCKKRFQADDNFVILPYAIGSTSEKRIIHVNAHSDSSSLLSQTILHKRLFQFATETATRQIHVVPLDLVTSILKIPRPYLVKIDTQGFELEVIKGGHKTLSNADVVLCEVAFQQLYESQPLFDELFQHMHQLGFMFSGMNDIIKNVKTGRVISGDAIFIKSDKL